jgi:hypothetical protein
MTALRHNQKMSASLVDGWQGLDNRRGLRERISSGELLR